MNAFRLVVLPALCCALVLTPSRRVTAAPIDSYRFPAIYFDHQTAQGPVNYLAEFTPQGPIAGTIGPQLDRGLLHVVRGPDGTVFGGPDRSMPGAIDPQTGALTPLPMTDPEVKNFPTGLTFDTTRNRLVVSTLGGQGFLLAYSPTDGAWTRLASLQNHDIYSLTYSANDDAYYAIGGMAIQRYDPEGQLVGQVPVNVPLDRNHLWDYQLIATGDRLALLTPPQTDALHPLPVQFSYLIDPHPSGPIELGAVHVVPEPAAAVLFAGAAGAQLLRRRAPRRCH
jgi:hypothetical protein